MSLFTSEFLRHAGEHLQIEDNDPPDINILPMGFMHLATTNEQADQLQSSWKMQIEKGARVAFWTKDELEQNFPFMNFDGIVAGTYGLENEGCIDTWQLLAALREKNITLGVTYLKGEVEGFQYRRATTDYTFADIHGTVDTEEADSEIHSRKQLTGVIVRPEMHCASARPIQAYRIVNAAGPWAGDIAEMAGIGKGPGLMSVPVPIKKRKRTTFLIHAPDCPDLLDMPAFFDPSGVFCRPNDMGYNFVCGRVPTKEEDRFTNHDDLTVDYNEFYEKVWPVLVKRIPLFKNVKVINGWAQLNDVNIYDDAPLLGEHLKHFSLYTMAGFGSYGPQMAIAAGRAYSERHYDDAYTSVNLRKFDMRRIMHGNRTFEPLKCF
uniref:FAD-dependent oxidoreductase domain-containing protein 1 n=1 Tax=Acrobeloides nanus TaxID=290746 RepID=A0A914E6B7_9BILA